MGGWGAGEPIVRTFRTYKLDKAHGIMFCGVRFTHFCITSPRETTNHVTQVLRLTLFGCHVALKAGFTVVHGLKRAWSQGWILHCVRWCEAKVSPNIEI